MDTETKVRKPPFKGVPTGKFKMREFQQQDIEYMAEIEGGSCNWSEMGCIAGTTEIKLNRAGKGFQTQIEWAYKSTHGLHRHPKSNWDSNIPTYAQSLVDGRVRLQRVLEIVDSGIKETVKLTTAFGRTIRLTADHLVLTDDGWIEAQDMLGRECIMAGGRDDPTFGLEIAERLVSVSLGDGRFIDKDGYVRVFHGNHPRSNRSGHVYEHILVMEEVLGREITVEEHVHHKDGNRSNNDPSNLEVKSRFDHHSDHAKERGFGTFGVIRERVVSVEVGQPEHVYDLIMEAPFHNFVANGIIVHNSFKTTTAEWLLELKLKHIPNPRVLIITTKTGKGPYLESLWEVLPGWDTFVVSTRKNQLVLNSRLTGWDVKLPDPLYMRPVIVIAHYACFTNRACQPQPKKDKDGKPIFNEETDTFEMVIPRCNELMTKHWDLVICDEAHRLKNPETQWTRNIKKIKASYKHIMTGTGFVNNPAEMWSLLDFTFGHLGKHSPHAAMIGGHTGYWAFREYFCNTPDAPIWMADLSFKSLGEIQVGDKVVGWDVKSTPGGQWGYTNERKLVESEVLAVNRRQAEVVEVIMKSGRKIKCTPDHLWLSGRGKGSIDRFVSVDGLRIGANESPQLVRVIDPTPPLEQEKIYAAAYIGAIMDGEGTWPIIAQSPTHNPEVHARIGEMLDVLEIPYTHNLMSKFRLCGIEGAYPDGTNGNGGAPKDIPSLERNLAARQRAVDFLNWCKPAKRDRIVNSVLGKGRWRLSDEVVSTRSIGIQEVVSMTTSTGNYIAWGYASKNCEEDNEYGYRKIVGIRPEAEFEFKELVRKVGVRRTMLECFPDITEPIETVVPVTLSPVQQRMYNGIQKELYTLDQQGVPLHSPTVLSALNRLRQISDATPLVKGDHYDFTLDRRVIEVELTEPSSKLDACMEIIEGLEWDEDRKDQVVVFCNFKAPLELLKVRLNKAKIPFLHLTANMNDKQRYELWHEQWPKKEHQVFLCTLAVGSESINLSSANRAIFIDQSWSPAMNKQAIGRVYRPGQTGAVQLIYIRAENTVDHRVFHANETKHGWFRQIFGNTEESGEDDESHD